MEKELLKVFETSKSDIDLIKDTIDIVKEKRKLNQETRLVMPEKQNKAPKDVLAEYNYLTHEIYVYEENFKTINFRLMRDLAEMGVINEFANAKKLLVMQLVLHELEHAYQKKLTLNKENNNPYVIISKDNLANELLEREIKEIEEEITALMFGNYNEFESLMKRIVIESKIAALKEKANINHQFYTENHDLFPVERAAEINSCKVIKEVLKTSSYQNLYHYFSSKKIFSEIKDYKKDMYPLLRYTLGLGSAKLLENLLPYMSEIISLDDRLFYGLEVKKEELNTKEDKLLKHLLKIK